MLFSARAALQLLSPAEYCVETAGEGLASAFCLPVPRCWGPGKKLISERWFTLGAEDNPMGLFMCSARSTRSCLTSTSLKSCCMAWAKPKLGKQANHMKSEGKWAMVHIRFCKMKVVLCNNTISCCAPAEDVTFGCSLIPGKDRWGNDTGMKSKQHPAKPRCAHQRQLCQPAWPNPDHSNPGFLSVVPTTSNTNHCFSEDNL